MANGYEQFFQKARSKGAAPTDRSSASERRFTLNPESSQREPQDRIVRRDRSRHEMIQELRRRVTKRRTKVKRKFPKSIVVISVLGSAFAGFGMVNHERLEKWMGQIEIVAFGQAQAEEHKAAPPEKGKPGEKADDKTAAGKDKAGEKGKEGEGKKEGASSQSAVTANDWKDEDVNHFRKLVDRKKELDSREEELNRQEGELQGQRQELEKQLKALEQTRRNISSVLQERVAEDEKKVDTLVQVYSNMKPTQAAKVLETMDEDLAVQIIGKMKKKNAAEVLNLMKAEKAQSFSEKFAGYKKN